MWIREDAWVHANQYVSSIKPHRFSRISVCESSYLRQHHASQVRGRPCATIGRNPDAQSRSPVASQSEFPFRRPIVGGNWKCNPVEHAKLPDLVKNFSGCDEAILAKCDVYVCPSNLHLAMVHDKFNAGIMVTPQNCNFKVRGRLCDTPWGACAPRARATCARSELSRVIVRSRRAAVRSPARWRSTRWSTWA